ncbi:MULTISPECIES: TRAP transporter substrate-binding protein DctP [unclassified Sporosarcina]|uniref:TRAP transporter substrate-binding protein DctP n=1 Tax=unclassified Sporosarcina TaxID=2647733 RepID=UPI0030F523D3
MRNSIKTFKVMAIVLMILLLVACSQDGEVSSAKGITLNAVSFLPKDHPLTATLHDWNKDVEEVTEGRVKVNWRGGADVIPIGEQFEAMNSGVMDINFTYIGQYQTLAPETLSIALSQIEPWEERENGFYDLMAERHEEMNVRYLGRWLTGSPRLWLNDSIDSVDDLEKMPIRSAPNYTRFFEKLGISSAMIDPSEVYTSLQTGVVKGFVYGGFNGPRQDGWTDSSKYVLDHPFWTQNCTILMNDDKWKEISAEDQEAILAATADYERKMVAYYDELDKKEIEELKNAGVELFKLPEEEEKKFLDLAYNTEWEYLESKVPELVDELRDLTLKND